MTGNKEILLITLETHGRLWNVHDLASLTWDFAHLLNFTPKEYDYHLYPGEAYTLTRFLAESHLTVDTYPEATTMEIGLTSCKEIIPNKIVSNASENFSRMLTKFMQERGLTIKKYTILQKAHDHKWWTTSC